MESKWRQKLHLEPPHGWLNDPNGLCFFGGKYHVYFQYSPLGANGEPPRCWGHFESADLIKWEFTGEVISPSVPEDRNGSYSGSAIAKDGVMHIFYTGNVKEEGDYDYILEGRGAYVIHVTTKDGHNMSEKKIVLANKDYPGYCSCHVRDPKVWEENGRYYMVLGARTRDDKGCVLYYASDDLESWRFEREYSLPRLGYMWECPLQFTAGGENYLAISPQGMEPEEMRFQNIYQSGYFVNEEFTEWDYGFDFYAPQTFTAPDGRCILIGWMGMPDNPYKNPTAGLGWQHCLTIPREVTRLADGHLAQRPVREIDSLAETPFIAKDGETVNTKAPFELKAKAHGAFKITIENGLELKYDGTVFALEFTSTPLGGGRGIRRALTGRIDDLRVISDTSSLEIYLDGGRYVISTRYYPEGGTVNIKLEGIEGTIGKMKGMEVSFNGK